jgi:hypothetical protein
MKAIRGMQRGVKQEPKLNKTEMLISMDKELKNMQMAGRVTQMMVQQMMKQSQEMAKDLGKAFGTINEMQYKILAMQSVGSFDMDAMAKKAEELRLNDFIEASDAEDKVGNFTISDKVQEDSTVIITSTTPDDDAGIFRSRIKLAECGVPALIKGLADQIIGTKVQCKLNGTDHVVELLAIRNPPPAVLVDLPTENVQVGEVVVNADGSEETTYERVPKMTVVH